MSFKTVTLACLVAMATPTVAAEDGRPLSSYPAAAAFNLCTSAEYTDEDGFNRACFYVNTAVEAALIFAKTYGKKFDVCVPKDLDDRTFAAAVKVQPGVTELAKQVNIHGFIWTMLGRLYSCNYRQL